MSERIRFVLMALLIVAVVGINAAGAHAQTANSTTNSSAYTSVLSRIGELDNGELEKLLGLLTGRVAEIKAGVDAKKRTEVEVQHPRVSAAAATGAADTGGASVTTTASGTGCSALNGLSIEELVRIQLANPLLGTNFNGSLTKAEADRIKQQTGIDLSAGLSSGNPCITRTTFLDAVASAAQAVAAAGASGTDGSRGSGLAPNNGAPQCNGNCDTLGSSDWEVCDGCTKGTSYGSYYDEDGVYHSGAKYDKSRDDNNLEIKIPGTNFAWRECDGNARYYYDFCGLTVYDPEGIKLTTAGFDPVTLLKVIDRFGIPIEQLNTVADYFDAEGIGYLPYELTGFGEGGGNAGNAGHYASDHGIDLRDLADGGLGTAYDWRLDNCDAAAAVPGFAWTKDGCERAADEDRAIAEKWGLTANDEVTTGVTVEEIHKNTGAWCDKPDDQLTADIYRESYGIGGWNHNGLQVDYESEKCAWLREPMGTPI